MRRLGLVVHPTRDLDDVLEEVRGWAQAHEVEVRQVLVTGQARRVADPSDAEAFDRELRTALAGTVWHSGCTNWYVDENGNDPNQWPWVWSRYRRRTARIEPGTYALAP